MQHHAIGGECGWDYLAIDQPAQHLYVSRSDRVIVLDARDGKHIGEIDGLPGVHGIALASELRKGFVSDGRGHVFDNIESKNELVEIDPDAMKVTAVWPLKDCDSPSGLAIDVAHHRLFSVCQNKVMAVTDSSNGNAIAGVPIGEGPDAARYDAKRGLVFSSNGRNGTLTVVREETPDRYQVLANVPTQKSARTMALDDASGSIFLSAAEFGARPKLTAAQPRPRPASSLAVSRSSWWVLAYTADTDPQRRVGRSAHLTTSNGVSRPP